MGFFDKIFGNIKTKENTVNDDSLISRPHVQNENAIRLIECSNFIESLLNSDIIRSLDRGLVK